MVQAWRIVSSRWADTAFDGEGARRFGGRWNSPGCPVVYLAGSRALAALETLVHLSPAIAARQEFVRFEVRIPKNLIRRLEPQSLSFDPFVSPETQAIGDAWLAENKALALEVPSAVVPEEPNFLLNIRHPRFEQIGIGEAEPFAFDPRLVSS